MPSKPPLLITIATSPARASLATAFAFWASQMIVKALGPQLASIRGISGATILGDGSIVLILDINALVRTGAPVVEIRKAAPTITLTQASGRSNERADRKRQGQYRQQQGEAAFFLGQEQVDHQHQAGRQLMHPPPGDQAQQAAPAPQGDQHHPPFFPTLPTKTLSRLIARSL